MDIKSIISDIEDSLYKGFTNTRLSDIDWLNVICGKFVRLFQVLHKNLIFDIKDTLLIEGCFLYAAQIICCIQYLERVLTIENTKEVVLSTSREFFLDRIIWCLSCLKTSNFTQGSDIELNFVYYMDMAIEIIEPHALLYQNSGGAVNIAHTNAESMVDSKKMRSVIDNLLAYTLAFANVVEAEDKKCVTALCHRVLRDCVEFEEECSLAHEHAKPNVHNRRLKAELLEGSLLRLEKIVNECLLHLVFSVYVDFLKDPLEELRAVKRSGNSEMITEKTEKFDLLNDRLIQMGIFGVVFADSEKAKSSIRSALASLESLENHLIPSIFSHWDDHHTNILMDHWKHETANLQTEIHKIIDTTALCASLLENISNVVDKLAQHFDATILNELLLQCEVFVIHLTINSKPLELRADPILAKTYENIKLMIAECTAALKHLPAIESSRIIKRTKILYSTVKKFHNCLKLRSSSSTDVFGDLPVSLREDTIELDVSKRKMDEDFFMSFGISPSICSILYKSRSKKFSESLVPQVSPAQPRQSNLSNISFRSRKNRMSLRVAMFKKQNFIENREVVMEEMMQHTLDLNITDILEQLTDLSQTLSGSSHVI